MLEFLIAVILLAYPITLAHELGHYFVYRMIGLPVVRFELGGGRLLFNFFIGVTEFRLSLTPLMGQVRSLDYKGENKFLKEDGYKDYVSKMQGTLKQNGFLEKEFYEKFYLSPVFALMLIAGPLLAIVFSLFLMWLDLSISSTALQFYLMLNIGQLVPVTVKQGKTDGMHAVLLFFCLCTGEDYDADFDLRHPYIAKAITAVVTIVFIAICVVIVVC